MLVRRLTVDTGTQSHQRVDAKDCLLRPSGCMSRARLQQRVLDRHLLRLALLNLLYVARTYRERHAQALKDHPTLWRGRGEHEPIEPAHEPLTHILAAVKILVAATAAARASAKAESSGKNNAASRAADSAESEPWTMFWPISMAKSPRIEPGAASSGLVAPIVCRAALTASRPSSTIATIGPEVMNATNSPKNGFSACSA